MGALVNVSVGLLLFRLGGDAAAQACPAGQGRLHEGAPCIASHIVDYLYCLNQSGRGRVEVSRKDNLSKNGDIEVSVGGKASGVIISGQINGGGRRNNSLEVINELNEKLDPSLTINCRELSKPGSVSPGPKSTAQQRPRVDSPTNSVRLPNSAAPVMDMTQLVGEMGAYTSPDPAPEGLRSTFIISRDRVGIQGYRLIYAFPTNTGGGVLYAGLSMNFLRPEDFSMFDRLEVDVSASPEAQFTIILRDIAGKQDYYPVVGSGRQQTLLISMRSFIKDVNAKAINGIFFVSSSDRQQVGGVQSFTLNRIELIKN